MYSLRSATSDDISDIMLIIADCQQFLHSRGVDQWQDGYPTVGVIELDVELDRGYVLEREGVIAAYGVLAYGAEESYHNIYNGEWLSNFDYITLHRLAVSSSFRGEGVGAIFFAAMESEAISRGIHSLRADTHRDNIVMQNLLQRMGFTLCGDIYLTESKAHRFGFERLL
ncbi:MAG: GNAT family N-acetyltransferase [Rikenellaceae bacterium]